MPAKAAHHEGNKQNQSESLPSSGLQKHQEIRSVYGSLQDYNEDNDLLLSLPVTPSPPSASLSILSHYTK